MQPPRYYRITYLRANGERVARDFNSLAVAAGILGYLMKWPRDTRPTLAPIYNIEPYYERTTNTGGST